MFKKLTKLLLTQVILLIILLISNISLKANSNILVYPGGDSIGVNIHTNVIVSGKYEVSTSKGKKCPWKHSNINVNDIILKVNNIDINTNNDLISFLKDYDKDECELTIKRNNTTFNTNIMIVDTLNNERSMGLYIKDRILGVGTLSFVTTDGFFASLGHGVYENNRLIDSSDGILTNSTVIGIKRAYDNVVGEKRAVLKNNNIGSILKIKNTGVYGKFNTKLESKKIKLANIDDISLGDAVIYSVINGEKIEKYNVKIVSLTKQDSVEVKGIKLKINDHSLINYTGGIIQGMSGSPIIQDGKLIGCLSHVSSNDPLIGYAMYARWMYDEIYK